ncbi:MAG: hypothetical protein PHI12_06490 [Dehalococcoidales bacterium]|nr:hypothetical protein [Dehalococcoidales bacterium]
MKRVLLILCVVIGLLIGLAMYWNQTEAVTGLIVALGGALTKLMEKVQ